MGDLAEFLLARIAEDEAAAKLCAEMFPPPWGVADRGWRVRIYSSAVPEEDYSSDDPAAMGERHPIVMEVEPDRRLDDPRCLAERVEHVRRHDPARTGRECEARRLRLKIADDLEAEADDNTYRWAHSVAEQIRKAEALPYAGHPDYREEWEAVSEQVCSGCGRRVVLWPCRDMYPIDDHPDCREKTKAPTTRQET